MRHLTVADVTVQDKGVARGNHGGGVVRSSDDPQSPLLELGSKWYIYICFPLFLPEVFSPSVVGEMGFFSDVQYSFAEISVKKIDDSDSNSLSTSPTLTAGSSDTLVIEDPTLVSTLSCRK